MYIVGVLKTNVDPNMTLIHSTTFKISIMSKVAFKCQSNCILAAGASVKFDPLGLPDTACPRLLPPCVDVPLGINQPGGLQPGSNDVIRVCGARFTRSANPDDFILTPL